MLLLEVQQNARRQKKDTRKDKEEETPRGRGRTNTGGGEKYCGKTHTTKAFGTLFRYSHLGGEDRNLSEGGKVQDGGGGVLKAR